MLNIDRVYFKTGCATSSLWQTQEHILHSCPSSLFQFTDVTVTWIKFLIIIYSYMIYCRTEFIELLKIVMITYEFESKMSESFVEYQLSLQILTQFNYTIIKIHKYIKYLCLIKQITGFVIHINKIFLSILFRNINFVVIRNVVILALLAVWTFEVDSLKRKINSIFCRL